MINKINFIAFKGIKPVNAQKNNSISFAKTFKEDTFEKSVTDAKIKEKASKIYLDGTEIKKEATAIFKKIMRYKTKAEDEYQKTQAILKVAQKSNYARKLVTDVNYCARFTNTENGIAMDIICNKTDKIARRVEFDEKTLEIKSIKINFEKMSDSSEKYEGVFLYNKGEFCGFESNVQDFGDNMKTIEEGFGIAGSYGTYVKNQASNMSKKEKYEKCLGFYDGELIWCTEGFEKEYDGTKKIARELMFNDGKLRVCLLNGELSKDSLRRKYGEYISFSNRRAKEYITGLREGTGKSKCATRYINKNGRFRKTPNL